MKKVHETYSLCPVCLSKLKAKIFKDENGILWMKKECKRHGKFVDKYFESELYEKFMKYIYDGPKINSNINDEGENCPLDCGLCKRHKSHTALANIVLTNRCMLQCNYCFFYTDDFWKKNVYEPSIEKIREMLSILASQRPIRCNAVQFTGGEPLLRDDMVEIVKLTKEMGFEQIQLNTTGIPLIQNRSVEDLIDVTTYYLSFDGISPEKNPKNHYEIPYIFNEMRKVNANVVLVPTVINGINDDEVGDIINFAIKHRDIVKSVNFQPVSLVGRLTRKKVNEYRITIPDLIKRIEEQTNGIISKDDFYPVPCIGSISRFVDSILGYPSYHFSTHPICGAGTYLFVEDEEVIPITRFFDVKGFFEYLDTLSKEIEETKLLKGLKRKEAILKVILGISKFLDKEKAPKSIKLDKLLRDIFLKKDYLAVGEFHMKSLMIGMMHFQDLYNYDIERVERCCIHYVDDEGRVIPFCAYNVIPEIYRDKVMRKYSVKAKEIQPYYVRDVKKLSSSNIYKECYSIKNYFKSGEKIEIEIEEV
ncbi:MAG: radical SAM protein [Candidatus Aenigmatarchaeota archaeon]